MYSYAAVRWYLTLCLLVATLLILLADVLLFAAILSNEYATFAVLRKKFVKTGGAMTQNADNDAVDDSSAGSSLNAITDVSRTPIDFAYAQNLKQRANALKPDAIISKWASSCVENEKNTSLRRNEQNHDKLLQETINSFPKFIRCAFSKTF